MMGQKQERIDGRFRIWDEDEPELVGDGRTFDAAKKDLDTKRKTTWTARRVAAVQTTIDTLLASVGTPEGITESEHLELQEMMDEFIGVQRVRGVIPTAIDHKETAMNTQPIRRRGGS